MKTILFVLSALLFSSKVAAQKTPPSINLEKESWKVDSVSGVIDDDRAMRKLNKSMDNMSMTFLENGRMLMYAEKQLILMNYDVSKGKKGTYLNLSGVVMLYAQILEANENKMILGFQHPKVDDSRTLKVYLSRTPNSLTDSLQSGFSGNYVLQEDRFSSYFQRIDPATATHMRLFDDGTMKCNFGTPDSGTWVLDTRSLELRLKGQQALYHFSIESYVAKRVSLNTLAGAKEKTYSLYRSKAAFFEGDENYPEVTEEMVEVMNDSAANPAKKDSELLCNSWRATTKQGKKITEETWLIFYPDGSVYYNQGKNKTKGTWSIMEGSGAIALSWNKKEEIALYRWEHTSLVVTFIPPGEQKTVTMEFSPLVDK